MPNFGYPVPDWQLVLPRKTQDQDARVNFLYIEQQYNHHVHTPVNPDNAPIRPTPWDDEFDARILDSKWTVFNQGTMTYVLNLSNLEATVPGTAGDNVRAFLQPIPGTPWEFQAKLSMHGNVVPYAGAGLILRESSTGKIILWWATLNNSAPVTPVLDVDRYTNETTSNSTPFRATASPGWPLYFALRNDGTTLHYGYSADGKTYGEVFTESPTAFLLGGADQVGIATNAIRTTVTPTAQMVCDWFRKFIGTSTF